MIYALLSIAFGNYVQPLVVMTQQANYLIPMAISLGFGIVFVTAIILVIVPCLYIMQEDITSLLSKDSKKAP